MKWIIVSSFRWNDIKRETLIFRLIKGTFKDRINGTF